MILELECPIKQYHWGKPGLQSMVAKLKRSADSSFVIDPNETYAELWMGIHQNGPALIKNTNITLQDWILKNPNSLGEGTLNKFGSNLPFLFKILSIGMPLSIQVHPSKSVAEKLHMDSPHLYKDSNYKPEIAIALSEFEALCGFRPMHEIRQFFCSIPELSEVTGNSVTNELLISSELNFTENLKKGFKALMTASQDLVKNQLDRLLNRIAYMDSDAKVDVLGNLLNRIHNSFPGDVGCFCIYFLNYLTLKPGEAIYLGASEPHAYILGDCVECMACSDNVVRAGLTPKYRDVDILLEILDYSCCPGELKLLNAERESNCSIVYRPPVPEFAVSQICVKPGEQYNLVRSSASIIIIVKGTATIDNIETNEGKVYFIDAEQNHQLQVPKSTVPEKITKMK